MDTDTSKSIGRWVEDSRDWESSYVLNSYFYPEVEGEVIYLLREEVGGGDLRKW